ncbi:MAG TPA: phospholipase D-like domain-containing protein [Anaerolineales bacterium]|nr:phospholipase D-like domain-containing protein [Anaerolineales bacterium]
MRNRLLGFYLFAFVILLFACGEATPTSSPADKDSPTPISDAPLESIELGAGYGVRGSWFELYFTDPTSPLSPQGTGGVDGPLVEAIDEARLSIDVAAYSLTLNSIRNALLRAHDRGVTIRIVMESDNMDTSDVQRLIEAGIPVVGDNEQGLMHNKFIVIDRSEVWLGSMNFTDSSAYEDNNNLMRIHSKEIAEDYSVEFREMFEDGMFGANVVPQTPHPVVMVDETRVEVYFAPDDHVLTALVNLLEGAEESIYFLAFSFTSNELGELVRQKAEEGLSIAGVMDEEQIASNIGTEFDPFRQAGLDVRMDGIEGQMHHKVFIVDGKVVVLGSYNFSKSAEERNDENLVILYDERIAAEFMKEFQRIWRHSYR